jgi:hypothetical protein
LEELEVVEVKEFCLGSDEPLLPLPVMLCSL